MPVDFQLTFNSIPKFHNETLSTGSIQSARKHGAFWLFCLFGGQGGSLATHLSDQIN